MPEQERMKLADASATENLARQLSLFARAGDLITLNGDLGTGKTTFARAFVRSLSGDDTRDVPSPTFTLAQSYDDARVPILHCDFYRLTQPDEALELGIEDALETGLVLVEWPENGTILPAASHLNITLEMDADGRTALLEPLRGTWSERLARNDGVRAFLTANGYARWQRSHLQGDASARRYERITHGERSLIVMDSPAQQDAGVSGMASYSEIARLAESVVPFVALADGLRAAGVHAPQIVAKDMPAGLLVLEDLGTGKITSGSDKPEPVIERYCASAHLLAHLHRQDLPMTLDAGEDLTHRIPAFSRDVFMAECGLLQDWYIPHVTSAACTDDARTSFEAAWDDVLKSTNTLTRDPTWVLRDYHSPNIVWCSGEGLDRVGVIDFQDALAGPAAYDLVSLAQDARIDMPDDAEESVRDAYLGAMGDDIDADRFLADYAVMGAQRNTKILGIFARLNDRDGKPAYLAHLPRIRAYLTRCLTHPSLAPVRTWYENHAPDIFKN